MTKYKFPTKLGKYKNYNRRSQSLFWISVSIKMHQPFFLDFLFNWSCTSRFTWSFLGVTFRHSVEHWGHPCHRQDERSNYLEILHPNSNHLDILVIQSDPIRLYFHNWLNGLQMNEVDQGLTYIRFKSSILIIHSSNWRR